MLAASKVAEMVKHLVVQTAEWRVGYLAATTVEKMVVNLVPKKVGMMVFAKADDSAGLLVNLLA